MGERREYQELKIHKTISPGRNLRSSHQSLEQFDNNLDYLLEDLQNSVSRPGSSLGNTNTYRETSRSLNTLDHGRSSSLNRISNFKSSNPVTEYSSDDAFNYTSPDGRKKVSGYKKETYSYATSGNTDIRPEKIRVENNINQLDSLLDDLQQTKKSTFERETYNSVGRSPDYTGSKTSVHRELRYGDTPTSTTSRGRSLERIDFDETIKRDTEYIANEGPYGQVRSSTPSSRTSTLTKQAKVKNLHSYPMEVIETVTPDINPEVLAHLDPSLRPPGNTKVTTTIKTYTYEIPGSGDYPTNFDTSVDSSTTEKKYVYSPNQSASTPSKSFVYNKVENKSAQNTVTYPKETTYQSKVVKESNRTDVTKNQYLPYQKPSPPGGHTVVKETVTTRNYQPGYSPDPEQPGNETLIYNETTTTRDIDEIQYPPQPTRETYIMKESNTTNKTYPPDWPVGNPPATRKETYIHKESHNTTTNVVPPMNGYGPGPDKTIIYEHESRTTNDIYPPPQRPADKTIIYEHESRTTNDIYPPPQRPPNVTYKYTSKNSTTNNYKGGYPPGDDAEILLPRPFPTDGHPEGPPKHLDELMADIGREPPNSPYNAGYTAHEREVIEQKKVSSLKQKATEADDMQRKEPLQKTKNITGNPVYYPPGEMFIKKEEAGAGWRAEGAYARESGKYESGADGGAKSKSKSGAAIVPVCLPLCCGLPCVIL